jgi:hypothetical protein
MPTQWNDRGGGLAPAHRRNLYPAHSDNQTLSKVIAAAPQPTLGLVLPGLSELSDSTEFGNHPLFTPTYSKLHQ